jgi:NAD(P)-dependent dehydrogenase (short-subunit alcohol dehydrogenase family)
MPDRTAFVTGGAGGLGRSVVDTLVADGWEVVVPVQAGSDLEAREHVRTVVADLTDPDEVARAIRAAGERLDAVVNLVGGFAADQPVAETPIAEFERMFALNLRPTYLVTQAAIPRLSDRGSIVCVGSATALEPFAGAAGYAASKAAVIAFAKTVAKEGVRCNVIVPSIIDTPANRQAMPESAWHRFVPPARIAAVVAFLCSDASAALNGAVLPV